MRLHRFFIEEQVAGDSIVIHNADLFHQLKHVFRYNVGSEIIVLDHSGFEYRATIISFARGEISLRIVKKEKVFVPEKEIWLFQSLLKKNNFEWILEKGTEIGISAFTPIISERSEKKGFNAERGRKILKESAEQSGRGIIPKLLDAISLNDFLTVERERNFPIIAFDGRGERFDRALFLDKKIGIVIGPEGGWSEKEIRMFHENNIPVYSLGAQTLRAETAAITAPSLFLLDFH